MRAIKLPFVVLSLLLGTSSAVLSHPDSGITLFAPAIPAGQTITVDGDVSDWVGWFPEAATITTAQTFPHVCADANCDPVPEDFDWTIRIAWDDASNKIYFSVEVFDDVWIIPSNVGERSLHRWDDLEIVSDPDNSGGLIGSTLDEDGFAGRHGQQWYFSQGAPGEGTRMEVIYYGADAVAGEWMGDPPYGESAFQLDGNRGVYEGAMVMWDFLSELGPEESIAHDLTANETIGFGFLYDEIDVAEGQYDAQWKTGPSTTQWQTANDVPDLLLLPLSTETAVEQAAWGLIKAATKK